MWRRIAVLGASLLSIACTATKTPRDAVLEVPEFRFAADAPGTALPARDGFLEIDAEMRSFVRTRIAPVRGPMARLQRLSALLLEPQELNLRYDGELTLSARETYHRRAGNCLSFTALAVVLAREAGLDAVFQNVPVLPNWRLSGDALLVQRHVNALVRVGSREFVLDFRPPSAAAYDRAARITDENAIAQYFGNLGALRFAAGDLAGAYRLYRRGLEVDPRAAPLWSNMGVALSRNGQWPEAEASYRNALAVEPQDLSALNNLSMLEQRQGDTAEAAALQRRLAEYRRSNPYQMYWMGERQLQAGDFAAAIDSFKSALEHLPTEADLHFALARCYRAQGRHELAARSLQAALQYASSAGIRSRYAAEFALTTP